MSVILSQTGFFALFALFAVAGAGSLLLGKYDELANKWNSIFSALGSLYGVVFALCAILSGHTLAFSYSSDLFPLLFLSFRIDMLSAYFIFIISSIALWCSLYGLGYLRHYYKKYNLGVLGFFYNLLVGSLMLVVTASNGIFFLLAWELMAIASYFLIVYERDEPANIKAGFLYFVMTYGATAFIIAAFLLCYKYTGSFDFTAIHNGIGTMPAAVKDLVFFLAVIGFGTKAGIIPFHIWLPAAHSAAPSNVSAFLSGVMIKTGIYMMIRMFLELLQPAPLWWGQVILVIGSVSALLGVLYALTEHDIKRLLAYHSIENIGIILLGLGSAMVFSSLGMAPLALLSLTAALFHTLNHATFKSLLFLSAGSVINQMHTRNMEEYGGLIKYMPQTAFFFLIGSMAISALPPFNGFFSEWLTYQSLFQGISTLDPSTKWIFIFAAGALAFTGGLAIACFVKVFGVTFLARPRSPRVAEAGESSPALLISMGALALLSLLFGVFSGPLSALLQTVSHSMGMYKTQPPTVVSSGLSLTTNNGFSSVSGPAFFLFFAAVLIAAAFVVRRFVYKTQNVREGETWNCGTPLTPRMEITAAGFSRSIIMIYRGVLKPSIQHEIEYHDSESRYLPKSRTVIIGVKDVHNSYIYRPLNRVFNALSQRAKKIQTGNINVYILYIFITLVIALYWVL